MIKKHEDKVKSVLLRNEFEEEGGLKNKQLSLFPTESELSFIYQPNGSKRAPESMKSWFLISSLSKFSNRSK